MAVRVTELGARIGGARVLLLRPVPLVHEDRHRLLPDDDLERGPDVPLVAVRVRGRGLGHALDGHRAGRFSLCPSLARAVLPTADPNAGLS